MIRRIACCLLGAAVFLAFARPASAGVGFSLIANPNHAIVGAPIAFVANLGRPNTFGPNPTVFVSFGDGATSPIITPTTQFVTFAHQYITPGRYAARLFFDGLLGAQTVVTISAAPRVPLGSVNSTVVLTSPVLAGQQTDINVTYAFHTPAFVPIATPFDLGPPFVAGPLTSVQAVIDLLDGRGALVRRADPVALPRTLAGGALQTVTIPYAVPLDGDGAYFIRVTLRSADGGIVAVGNPVALLVIAGPDPVPAQHTEVHAAGPLQLGGPQSGGGGFNAAATAAVQFPGLTSSLTGTYDPTSHKIDPLLKFVSATPGPVKPPDAGATPEPGATVAPAPPASSAPRYVYQFFRLKTQLPAFLGGDNTIRGGDVTYDFGQYSLHGGAGYTQLFTSTTSEKQGSFAEFKRPWNDGRSLRMSIFRNHDNPHKYVDGSSLLGPQDGNAEVLEYVRPLGRTVTLSGAGGFSSARSLAQTKAGETAPPNISDAADRFGLHYGLGQVSLDADYHNFGNYFSTGGGLNAVADSVGGSAVLNLALSPATTLSLVHVLEQRRSAFAKNVKTSGTFAFGFPTGGALSFALERDRSLADGQDATTNQGTLNLNRSFRFGNLVFNTVVTALRDALTSSSDSVSRTGTMQLDFGKGAGRLALGINGSLISGGASSANVGQSLTYGVSFGRMLPGSGGAQASGLRRWDTRLSVTHAASHTPTTGGADLNLVGLLSYHIIPQAALGLEGDSGSHKDIAPGGNSKRSSLRLRLDLQI